MKDKYDELLTQYPAFVGLEQLRLMCHISKRKASYILTSGLIPSVNSGKKTRQYKIAVKDIVAFLRDIEVNPEKYSFPSFSSGYTREQYAENVVDIPMDKHFFDLLSGYYKKLLDPYPDLLTTTDTYEIVGYSKKTVNQWISEKRFLAFQKNGYLIPKSIFHTYITGKEFVMRSVKSQKHQSQLSDILQNYNK